MPRHMVIVLSTALLLAVGIAVATWGRVVASADADPRGPASCVSDQGSC
jgi:hypothetical protein